MAGTSALNRFYLLLLVLAVGGGGFLYWQTRSHGPSIPANVVVTVADTAGFSGYYLGDSTAPVVVTEYADFECPACQTFDVVQFPDVRRQVIGTGKVRWRYRDFPLSIHPYSRVAAHSAACANDQGHYWEQHAVLYQGQGKWAREADPTGTFRDYAKQIGLDLAAYDACMKSAKYAGRIQASYDEGVRVGVGSTPTFLIAGRLYEGVQNSDELKKLVDSLAAAVATPR
jgi:protein-disulfide isomerase